VAGIIEFAQWGSGRRLGFAANLGLYEVAASDGGFATDSLKVSTMPSGRSTLIVEKRRETVCPQRHLRRRSEAPSQTSNRNIGFRAGTVAVSFAKSATASAGRSQWLGSQDAIVGVFRLKACHLSHHLTDCHKGHCLSGKSGTYFWISSSNFNRPFVQQQANCSRREYDGSGSGSKPVTGRNGRAVLDIRKAKTLRPHDLAIDTDSDREPARLFSEMLVRTIWRACSAARAHFASGGDSITDGISL